MQRLIKHFFFIMTTAKGEGLKAAIDLGSNSFRLLIRNNDLGITPVKETVTVRLGEGLAREVRIGQAAFARGIKIIEEFKAALDRFAVLPQNIRACGTESLRRAEDSSAFIDQASGIIGRRIEIISGEEEAALTLAGVLSGMVNGPAHPLLVADIGAGSTELISASTPPEIDRVSSLQLGAAIISMVIKEEGLAAARKRIDQAIAPFLAAIGGAPTLILSGGSATTCAAIDLGLEPYIPQLVQGHEIDRGRFGTLSDKLLSADEKGLAKIKGLAPERAGIIGGGALICLAIIKKTSAQTAIISDLGLLEGIFLSIP